MQADVNTAVAERPPEAPPPVQAPAELSREQLWARLIHMERLAQAGLIATGLVHDTRTLLAVVQGYCALAKTEVPEGPAQELMHEAQRGALRAGDTLASLMAFSKNTALQAGRCDAAQILQTAARFLAASAREAGVALHCDALDVADVRFNDQVLLQAVTNLVVNAVRACRASGSQVRLSATSRNHSVVVRVTDDGPGIPRRIRKTLFEPFATTEGLAGGTGLGLYITRRLVEGAGGRIACEATSERGTVFAIEMPRYVTTNGGVR